MANSNLVNMTADTLLDSTDIMYTVIDPAGTPLDRKVTVANLSKSCALAGIGAANTIASATTTNLATATSANITISGTTTITAFGTVAEGATYILTFSGALTLTHNGTSLILPGSANITTANGDVAIMKSLGSGNWKCVVYTPVDGEPVIAPYLPLAGGTMTGAIKQAAATIASATTTDLNTVAGNSVTVSGTTQIDALGTVTAGAVYALTFADALQLTHNGTSLILPSGANITTAANDTFWFKSLGSGNWVCIGYVLASGEAIVGGGGGGADATVTGTDNAATDLAALNAAITAVAASATAPKSIEIVGTFAMGATRASPISYITLICTRAYMKQSATFTDSAPWFCGTNYNIQGGVWGTTQTTATTDKHIMFGDTTTASEGPCGNVTDVTFDATWNSLNAATTVMSFADTDTNTGGIISVSSWGVKSTSNRQNIICGAADGAANNRQYNFYGAWMNMTLGGQSCQYNVDYAGGTLTMSADESSFSVAEAVTVTTSGGDQSIYSIGIVGTLTASASDSSYTIGDVGALTANGSACSYQIGVWGVSGTLSGGTCKYSIGRVSNAVTMSGTESQYSIAYFNSTATLSATKSTFVIGTANFTVDTTSGDNCSYTIGHVNNVLTGAATDSVYNIGTLVAASQVLSGANNTYNIGEVSSSVTCSGTESSYTISKLVGAGTFSATKSTFRVSTADSTITTASGDGCTYNFGTVTGVLTGAATDSSYVIGALVTSSNVLSGADCSYAIGECLSSITISGANSIVNAARVGGIVTLSANGAHLTGTFGNAIDASSGTDCFISGVFTRASSTTYSIGVSNIWRVSMPAAMSGDTFTMDSGSLSIVDILDTNSTGSGTALYIIAATCDSCTINIQSNASSGFITVTGGAFNNQINVISDVTPSFTGDADIENIVYWQRYSTTVNYQKILVSHKGPNRIAQKITAADVVALGASLTGEITITPSAPAHTRVTGGYVGNRASAATGTTTLTASIGKAGDSYIGITTAATVQASNATSAVRGTTAGEMNADLSAATEYKVQFVSTVANLDQVAGAANGWVAVLELA